MSIRVMMMAGLLGVPLLAGTALAVDAGRQAAGENAAALIQAATKNDLAAVDSLLKAGVDPNGANDYGATALYAAAASADPAMVAKLLAAGADVNTHLMSGETPLMEAALRGNLATVKALLAAGADPNLQEKNGGQTALM